MQRRKLSQQTGAVALFPYLIWAKRKQPPLNVSNAASVEITEEDVFLDKYLELADTALKVWHSADHLPSKEKGEPLS